MIQILVEPEDNYDEEKIQRFEEMLKMMICLTCHDRFPNTYQLKLHMLQVHQVEVSVLYYFLAVCVG